MYMRSNLLRSSIFNRQTTRLFGATAMKKDTTYINSHLWQNLTEHDKLQTALSSSSLNTAELAFYQGMGLKKFGLEYSSKAIYAFERAIELDTAGAFTERAKAEIAKLEEEQFRNII